MSEARWLEGRRALVTGAGRNIGRAIALEMARHGAGVVVVEKDEAACAAIERELRAITHDVRVVAADVSDPDQIAERWPEIASGSARIDILVHNAAVKTGADSVRGFERGEWERVLATNVVGPMEITRRIVDALIVARRGGSILFLSSIHERTPRRIPSYSASKAALAMIVRELAIDLAPHEIRVNAIAPGYVAADDRGRAVAHKPTPLYAQATPPEFIAHAAAFLASDTFSRHTTGAVLTIDGGLSLHNHLTLR